MTAQPAELPMYDHSHGENGIADVIHLPVQSPQAPLESLFISPQSPETNRKTPQAVELARAVFDQLGIQIDTEDAPGSHATDEKLAETYRKNQMIIEATPAAMRSDSDLRAAVRNMYDDTEVIEDMSLVRALAEASKRIRSHYEQESPEMQRWRITDRLIRLHLLRLVSPGPTAN